MAKVIRLHVKVAQPAMALAIEAAAFPGGLWDDDA
jgi:hypothetical protein